MFLDNQKVEKMVAEEQCLPGSGNRTIVLRISTDRCQTFVSGLCPIGFFAGVSAGEAEWIIRPNDADASKTHWICNPFP